MVLYIAIYIEISKHELIIPLPPHIFVTHDETNEGKCNYSSMNKLGKSETNGAMCIKNDSMRLSLEMKGENDREKKVTWRNSNPDLLIKKRKFYQLNYFSCKR